jgi:cold-inducible RNA-binding protein
VAKMLYVGNLSSDTTDSDLQTLFVPHGTVQSAHVCRDRDAGRSKGFGFVEMDSDPHAQAAIEALNRRQLQGRTLTIWLTPG